MPKARARRTARKNITRTAHIPAPIGGLNTVDRGFEMPDADCPVLFNMIAAENGVRVRLGYREWSKAVGSGAVPTVIPFHGSAADGSKDRLWATTNTAIYDVSATSDTATLKYSFASGAGDTGWCVFHGIVNIANAHFMMLCDEVNGYHVYTESTDTWAAVTAGGGANQVSGVDPALFRFVTVWKNWALFVEKDTSRMWFGNVTRALYGTMTSWDFGAQFQHGGSLVGLWGSTGDYGIGMDDHLVAISSSGDIVIYKGTDPNTASAFQIVGRYYVGGVPAGRRIATNHGGELLILSSTGLVPLSKLVTGTEYTDTSLYATQKISNEFNNLVSTYGTIKGWATVVHPEDATVLILTPIADGQPTTQLAMSLRTRGWSKYRDLPILSAESWKRRFFFGTADGRVCVGTGYQDNVSRDASTYSVIKFSGITAFRNGGKPTQKQLSEIRATYLFQGGLLSTTEEARYRYDLREATPPTVIPPSTSSVFDVARFDSAIFAGDYATQQIARGAAGIGPDVAVAFAGSVNSRTVLVGIDVVYTEGGVN